MSQAAPASTRWWFTTMDGAERRTFWGCFAGWGLDALDVQIFSLVLPTLLGVAFLHDKAQAGLIATVTLLCSALGGWLAGALADRLGRVRMLQVTVAWFAVFTLLCGFAQNAGQLLAFRALMGFGFGGEWAVGAVLIAETVRARYRGRAVGTVQSAWAVGWALAVGVFVLVSSLTPPSLTWRIAFFVGVLPAVLVFFLRRYVPEPPIAANAAGTRPPLREALAIFGRGLWKRTLLCSLLATGAQGGYYALTTWLPQFLTTQRGLALFALGGTLAIVIAGAFTGYLVGAWLADRLGRRRTLIITAVLAFVIVIPYATVDFNVVVFDILAFPLGFVSSAYFSAIGPLFSEQYPTAVRGSGQGFTYNFGRGIGAVFPALVGLLADRIGISVAIAVFTGIAYALLGVAAALLGEAPGVPLTDIEPEADA
ncbi:MAG TPA: MFS transporter [Streptosporangiaceae bacterium]|jgi:MFS family permease